MQRRWVIACLASLISCGGMDGDRTGYLFVAGGDSPSEPAIVKADGWKRTTRLPLSFGIETHPIVLTGLGEEVIDLAAHAVTVVDTDSGAVETLALERDVASDLLRIRGTEEGVRELADMIDADLVSEGGERFALHADGLLDRVSLLDLPRGVTGASLMRLSPGQSSRDIWRELTEAEDRVAVAVKQLKALLSRERKTTNQDVGGRVGSSVAGANAELRRSEGASSEASSIIEWQGTDDDPWSWLTLSSDGRFLASATWWCWHDGTCTCLSAGTFAVADRRLTLTPETTTGDDAAKNTWAGGVPPVACRRERSSFDIREVELIAVKESGSSVSDRFVLAH